MALTPLHSPILLDIGISFGDEGKGRLIPELVRELSRTSGRPDPVGAVLKVNGGANSGHTSGGLKLNLFPAGVIEAGVPVLAIGSGVVADPHKFLWESAYIEHHGHRVRDRLLIDERTMVSDLAHRLLDLAWEHYRTVILGEEKRGSTARGISPAYADETLQFAIHYADFRADRARFGRRLRARAERALRVIQHVCQVGEEAWNGFFATLTAAETRAHAELITAGVCAAATFDFHRFQGAAPFSLDLDALEESYWQAGQQLLPNIGDVRECLLAQVAAGRTVIGEFGQAFWLDKRAGFAPNVTASHTLPAEFFLSAGLPLQPVHVIGVCKAYDTKVGTHTFICRLDPEHPLGAKLSRMEFGATTGRQRMVGWFDAVEKGDALRYGGFHDLVINKLDALSWSGAWQGGELLICTAYRAPDGSVLQHVPRNMELHRSLRPVYRQLPGWGEDISGVRSFAGLPAAARRYVANMLEATLTVACGPRGDWPASLPNVRYIGVGPDPEQIIGDIPSTDRLLEQL
jgi:adenylosuccinate synthase